MIKIYLIFAIALSVLMITAQKPANIPEYYRNFSKSMNETQNLPAEQRFQASDLHNQEKSASWNAQEDIIGGTYYDVQSPALLDNRLHSYGSAYDDLIGATWMLGMDYPGFPNSGAGYNYFDGNNWTANPTQPVGNTTGFNTNWPSYAPYGDDGEIIASESDNGIVLCFRNPGGMGNWNCLPALTDCKAPRILTSGPENNTLHLLSASAGPYQGQTSALFYSRSSNGGQTWEVEKQVIAGTGSGHYTGIEPHHYVWAKGGDGVIAFIVASAWHDMFLMKSDDGGDNWEKTVIWEHPYPFFDWNSTITDTFYCVDNSASVALDNNNTAHISFGISRAIHDQPGPDWESFPYVGGVGYWKEGNPTFSDNLNALSPYDHPESELIPDTSLIAYMWDMNGNGEPDYLNTFIYQYPQFGCINMPGIITSNYDDEIIHVVYSSITEDYFFEDSTLYRHIWMRSSSNGGNSWSSLWIMMTSSLIHNFDECVYPVAASPYSDHLHMIFQADNFPGTAIQGHHDYAPNNIYYLQYSQPWGTSEHSAKSEGLHVYPNPASEHFLFSLDDPENLGYYSLKITNYTGQVLLERKSKSSAADKTPKKVNIAHLKAGMYVVSATSGNKHYTRKLSVY